MRELPVRKGSSIQSLRTLFRSIGRPICKTVIFQSCLVADCKTLPLHTPLFSAKKPSIETYLFFPGTLTAVPSGSMSPSSYLPPGKAVS